MSTTATFFAFDIEGSQHTVKCSGLVFGTDDLDRKTHFIQYSAAEIRAVTASRTAQVAIARISRI